jgi:hypothetical protein
MGYGQYSSEYHKPFNKAELMEHAARFESVRADSDWRDFPLSLLDKPRLVAKNTLRYSMFRKPGIESVCTLYHKTRILDCTYDNQIVSRPLLSVTIETGGYNSVTTRSRLNDFLPRGWRCFTESGCLYIRTLAGTFPHCDGAIYDGNGAPVDPALHQDSAAIAALDRKAIKAFCNAITPDNFPKPSAGDPWCGMLPDGWNPKVIGAETLRDWLETEYVKGSLIVAAMRRKGWQDAALARAYDRPETFLPQVKRACRDFFKAGLGLA